MSADHCVIEDQELSVIMGILRRNRAESGLGIRERDDEVVRVKCEPSGTEVECIQIASVTTVLLVECTPYQRKV